MDVSAKMRIQRIDMLKGDKMTDLSVGILDIAGVQISEKTVRADLEAMTDGWRVHTRPGATSAMFASEKPVEIGDSLFSCYLFVPSQNTPPEVSLRPIPNDPSIKGYDVQEALNFSKQWLRSHMKELPPVKDTPDILAYETKWGYAHTMISKDRDGQWVGGTIEIHFNGLQTKTVH